MAVFSLSCSSTSPLLSFKNNISFFPSHRRCLPGVRCTLRVKATVSVEFPSSSSTDRGDDSPNVLLEVRDLSAVIAESKQQILNGVNLTVHQSEVYAVMGKNGSGKSTFSKVLGANLAILDEIDSGLDVDALRDIGKAVNGLLSPKNSVLMITHYLRLLEFIKPTYIHIMENGKIVKTGGISVAKALEKEGYKSISGT